MAYVGWKNLHIKGARDEDAVKASIGRKKYGKGPFQKAAAKGKKMRGMKHRTARDGVEALMERRKG